MITGQVIEGEDGTGRSGLLVAAMENINAPGTQPGGTAPAAIQLGTAKTNVNGRFQISLSADKINLESPPDIFFNVYDVDGKTLLDQTYDYVAWNASTQDDVTITLYKPTVQQLTPDKLTVTQGLAISKFLAQSDFNGVITQVKSQVGTTFGVLGDSIVNSITKINLTPLSVPVQSNSIVNNDVATATRHLTDQDIQYTVMDYNPALNKDLITSVTGYATVLKPGQTVNLYQQDGVVKYYSVVPVNAAPTPASGQVNPPSQPQQPGQSADIARLKEELTATKSEAARKDEQIALLTKELEAIRKDQSDIRAMLEAKFPS